MKILILGSGGREHALAWKLAQSERSEQIFIAPGNPGTSEIGENVPIAVSDFEALHEFVKEKGIEMMVVGPEEPLVKGVYDYFRGHDDCADLMIVGPSKAAAKIEGSKAYAKKFMEKYGIPTANALEVTKENFQEGIDLINETDPPIVLKADGLAAGKGVIICQSREQARVELGLMIGENKFGEASDKVLIEEFLDGFEFSVFVLTDGEHFKILPTAKDYKRVGAGDTGLNTGGMGAISPPPFVDKQLLENVISRIAWPTVRGLKEEGVEYKGFIFCGLISVDGDPYVIEYNCRLGDPETQVVLPRIESDLVDLFEHVAKGTLDKTEVKIANRHAATVVMASGGYPEDYEKGKVIQGIDAVSGSLVFQAGTKTMEDDLLTNGGRVLSVTSYGLSISDALDTCYKNIDRIDFDKKYYRSDIGFEFI